jgi:hypothetical protein
VRIVALLLLLAWGQAEAATWYVGPTSAGSANGTSAANQWGIASVGWSSMASGDTLTMSVGTYSGAAARFNINSTSANYSTTNPLIIEGNSQTLDCDSAATHCLYIKAAVGVKIQNLNVREASNSNIRFDGSDGTIGLHDVTLVNVTSNASGYCGFQIDSGAYNVTLREITATENYDTATDGGSGDGVCTGGSASTGNVSGLVIEDCNLYNNSDDGLDLFQMNNPATVRRCQLHDNGYASGDGRGIAAGPGTGAHVFESLLIWGNDQFGIHRRDNSGVIVLRNNTIHDNGLVISGGRDINFPNTVDLNFPTSQTRFTDSGVNSEYRALSAPVSSLSVGAQSYTLGTVGALASNQFGNSGGYVYVKGNPGTSTVTAVPTTQSTAYSNWSSNCGLNNGCNNSDTVTGLTTTDKNSWDLAITDPGFVGGSHPTTAAGFKLVSGSALRRVGRDLNIGNVQDYGNRAFMHPPSIGAWEAGDEDAAAARTAASARTARQ